MTTKSFVFNPITRDYNEVLPQDYPNWDVLFFTWNEFSQDWSASAQPSWYIGHIPNLKLVLRLYNNWLDNPDRFMDWYKGVKK